MQLPFDATPLHTQTYAPDIVFSPSPTLIFGILLWTSIPAERTTQIFESALNLHNLTICLNFDLWRNTFIYHQHNLA